MTSLPDKHFRDNLEHFKKSPPPQAWSRIESGLNKNKSKGIWLSVAATIIVLISASILLWHPSVTSKNSPVIAADNSIKTESANTPTATTPQIDESTLSPAIKPTRTIHNASEKSMAVDKQHSPVQEPAVAHEEVIEEIPEEKSITKEATVSAINSSSAPESIAISDNNSSAPRSNKITYSSGEVNSRFLKKDSTVSIPPTEKTTGIQKILDIASGFKYDESAFGDLREIKNEYLSIPIKEQTKEK